MKPVRWTDNQEHPTPWRHGRSVYRTIYDANEVLIGMMDTAELAEIVIFSVNIQANRWEPISPTDDAPEDAS
jgi:hypothetical protein